jgi:hypothetical protein
MSQRTKDGTYSVSISIALNGQDFSPFATDFAFYQDPDIEEVSPKEAVTRDTVELKGKGLYDSGLIVVRLTYATEDSAFGEDVTSTVRGDYDSLTESIKFALPDLPVTLTPPEDPDAAEDEVGEDPAARSHRVEQFTAL